MTLKLPATLPAGEAEMFVIAGDAARALPAGEAAARDFRAWLGELLSRLPPAPARPSTVFDRARMCDD